MLGVGLVRCSRTGVYTATSFTSPVDFEEDAVSVRGRWPISRVERNEEAPWSTLPQC